MPLTKNFQYLLSVLPGKTHLLFCFQTFRNLSIPVLSRWTSLKQATAWKNNYPSFKIKCTLAKRQGCIEVTEVWERLRVFKVQAGSPAKARHKLVRCASSNWRKCLCLNLTYILNVYLIVILAPEPKNNSPQLLAG